MVTKRSVIVALVGLNLLLAAVLVLTAYPPQTAYAQRAGGSGEILAATCRIDKDYDALYLVDLGERKLHCFVPDRDQSGAVYYAGSRDLLKDFER